MLYSIVAFDFLPVAWRFEHWPASLRDASVFGFVLFSLADLIFAATYFFVLARETYGSRRP
jgi:hypothetical protein